MAGLETGKIGIFDSGVGGLTVLKEVMKLLPYEEFVYFGDTGRVPYGNRDKDEIIRFSLEIVNFLLKQDIKALIIACNTIDSAARMEIKKMVEIPVFGVIKSGVDYAYRTSESKNIGLIATKGTVDSRAYNLEFSKLGTFSLKSLAIPEFVEIVESGQRDGLNLVIRERLAGFNNSNIDTLILGCTHFPVIEGDIRNYLREDIKIIDPAIELGKNLKTLFPKPKQDKDVGPRVKYYVSSNKEKFKEIGQNILGIELENVEEISL